MMTISPGLILPGLWPGPILGSIPNIAAASLLYIFIFPIVSITISPSSIRSILFLKKSEIRSPPAFRDKSFK